MTVQKITRVLATKEGGSRFDEIEVPLYSEGEIGFLSKEQRVKGIWFRETDGGYDYDWHNAPRKQYVIMLSGSVDITTTEDGTRRFSGGDVIYVADITGKGHVSRHVEGQPRKSIFWEGVRFVSVMERLLGTGLRSSMRTRALGGRPFRTSVRRAEEGGDANAIKRAEYDTSHEGMLWFDNVFPLKMGSWDIRSLLFRHSEGSLLKRAKDLIPAGSFPHEFTVKDMIPRPKDGGTFLKYNYVAPVGQREAAHQEIASKIQERLAEHRQVAFFNFLPLRAFQVHGVPFMEDLVARYPSLRLRVEFFGPDLSTEQIYNMFRTYGRIYDVTIPAGQKEAPRYAIVQFLRMRSATSARNCENGVVKDGTRINILYERQVRANFIKDWLMNHPRITVPLAAASVAGITYTIFDPIRTFFVTSKLTQRFNPDEYAIYRWLRKETWSRILPSRGDELASTAFASRKEEEDKLNTFLREDPDTFLLVSGPKGSGKSGLVKEAIKNKKHKVYIDGNKIVGARNDNEMIAELARQVNYYPVFTWMVSASSMADTLVSASTGIKGQLSSTTETQIKQVLEILGTSLHQVSPLTGPHEQNPLIERLIKVKDTILRIRDWFTGREEKEHEREASIPQNDLIPVVIIDGYLSRERGKEKELWDHLAEFAALLVENRVAHVIFISSNNAAGKALAKALPNKPIEDINLSDADPEAAMAYIRRQLDDEDENAPGLLPAVDALGGRLTDLELLVQKVKGKMTPSEALDDIISKAVIEIRKYGFGDDIEGGQKEGTTWSPIQFWQVMSMLAQHGQVDYESLKWKPFFKGADAPLVAMEHAELIHIEDNGGRPTHIRPGKPVYKAAFQRIMSDHVFAATMELQSFQYLQQQQVDAIKAAEAEIKDITSMYGGRPPREVSGRLQFLLKGLQAAQMKVEEFDHAIAAAKAVIDQ